MKKALLRILVGTVFLGGMVAPGFAQHAHEQHQARAAEKSGSEMMPMMMKGGGEMKGMPCMVGKPSLAGRLDMMTCMLTGRMHMDPDMMHAMMAKAFFLDRVEELGLQKAQIERLKEIRAACRRDNLRTVAEVKIARLELEDLLEGDWRLDAAEKLVRMIGKLEGDLKVRHLKAAREALDVLTPEQAAKTSAEGSLESLFD